MTPLVGKGGLDKDIGLHLSQALVLTPLMNLFNLSVLELQAGLAPGDRFFDTTDIGVDTRLIVSRLSVPTESAQASLQQPRVKPRTVDKPRLSPWGA
jgi:hypothetical protein